MSNIQKQKQYLNKQFFHENWISCFWTQNTQYQTKWVYAIESEQKNDKWKCISDFAESQYISRYWWFNYFE